MDMSKHNKDKKDKKSSDKQSSESESKRLEQRFGWAAGDATVRFPKGHKSNKGSDKKK
jgi:hypothetical protein